MTEDHLEYLSTYRAHRFAITRLDNGEFALFDPSGDLIGIGTLDDLAPQILTGEAHYETCADLWISRRRDRGESSKALIEALGIHIHQPKIDRRI